MSASKGNVPCLKGLQLYLLVQSKEIFKNLDSTIQSILIFVDLMSWCTLEQGTSLNSRPSLDFLMKGIACFYSMYTTSYFWLYMYIVVWSLKSTDWPLQLSLEESNIYIAGSNSHVGIVQSTYLDVIFCIYDVSGSVVYYNTYIVGKACLRPS